MTDKAISTNSTLICEKGDTGSAESQICYLTDQVSKLTSHLKSHSKDYSSQRGLWKLLGRRKRLLIHSSKKDPTLYDNIISNLGIRRLKRR
uniref:Small ribosomal subunit protein uS15c n=1 Tax=Dipteris conjugata TaxID=32108 RepID=A0A0B5E847_9MONI|nr:ribosomal protein S15 [Dipteris conjugata]